MLLKRLLTRILQFTSLLGILCLTLTLNAQTANVVKLRWENSVGLRFNVKVNDAVSADETSEYLLSLFNLPKNHQFVQRNLLSDDNANYHIRYSHFLNGVKINGSEIVTHFSQGKLSGCNGILYFPNSTSAVISQEAARNKAFAAINAESYMWQNPHEEKMLKTWLEDSNATYYPKGELHYVPQSLDFSLPFALCYGFDVYASSPTSRTMVFVNAENGTIWAMEQLMDVADAEGVANTKYRGNKAIVSDSLAPDTFRLRETGRGNGIETYNMQTGKVYASAVDFIDSDNYWNNYNADFDEVAGDAHFGAERTYDYFYSKFNRNSFDGNGAKIRSFVHYDKKYSNAFWNGFVMTYGDGNGTSIFPLISIDVVGHEIAHAVTTNTANLVYSYESGALNESFSDIFGNAIEYFADSNQFNWRMGEDITASGNGLRNMASPKTHRDPDTYKGTYWHTAASDNGGVHTNSGVQNYWFYLLCHGKSGTNDNGDNYAVDSLGIYKAEAIAYRNLSVYLTRSSDYEEARYYAIRSAADLFGECSNEVIATTNAWYAVGVGNKYDSSFVLADFVADTAYCQQSEGVQFQNKSINALGYKWYFGDGDSSVLQDPLHTYPGQGVYSIKLIAEGCYNSVFDTIEKINYIEIDSTRDICNALIMPYGGYDTVYACTGFVYDNGGEDAYYNLVKDTLTVWFGANDSAYLVFEEFGYENKYDSIYLYDGFSTEGRLIGGYTGNNLPNGGSPIKIDSGAFTIRHFSDPYVTGIGFKLKFEAFRPEIQHSRTPDTLVCYKQDLDLVVNGVGGEKADYVYYWNGVVGDSILHLNPTNDTIIYLQFGDGCVKDFIYDTIQISVRDSLKLESIADTTLCYLEDIELIAQGTGGDTSSYVFEWLPDNVNQNPWNTEFAQTQMVRVALSDGCTNQQDTVDFVVTVRDSLSQKASNDTLICEGNSVDLSIDVTGGLNAYSFTGSEGTSISAVSSFSITVSPLPGQNKYWISYTDNCTDTKDTAHFVVTVRDSLRVTTSPDTTICFGSNAKLRAVASGGDFTNYTYNWGSGFATDSSFTINPKTTTSYQVKLKDGCSVFEPEATVFVSVLDSLEVDIIANDTACYGQLISFQTDVSGGLVGSYNYTWQDGSTLSSISTKLYKDFTFMIEVTDGCSAPMARDSFSIVIREPLHLLHADDTAICLGDDVVLEPNTSGGNGNYFHSWDNGLGLGFSKLVKPTVNTTYTVTLTDKCSEPFIKTIDVNVNPKPEVDFDVSIDKTCIYRPIIFTNKTVSGAGSKYAWNFGDGQTSTTENVEYWYGSIGAYNPVLTVENEFGCVSSSDGTLSIDIIASPQADFNASPFVGDYINSEIQFINTSANATNYFWSFGDGSTTTNENTSHKYIDTGWYEVMLVASNDYNCFDTLVNVIRINDVFLLHLPTAFTPNGDGINDEFRIQSRGLVSAQLIVYNRWGEVIWKTDNAQDSWDGTINGELVSQGMYYYTISGSSIVEGRFTKSATLFVIIN